MTGVVAKYMREHMIENEIWDEGQLGAVEGVLGTVDQLIIDRCIMDEVKHYHRNLAVALYDYKKAYDKVHHDWMLRVYQWIGIPDEVIKLISPCIMCVQYIGGCSVHWGVFSTSGGYHEYIGGYHEYIGGCSVHRGIS